MIKDMTEGKPLKVIFTFTLPMLLSLVFQQLYTIVDSVIAGQAIGLDALAATGASFPITMLFIAIGTGSSVGSSVVVSQFFGARRYSEVKTSISTAIITFLSLGALLTAAGILICRPLLSLMKTPDNIFADAAAYLDIYIFGVLFMFAYNTATAVFNALGDSKTPLIFLAFSSILNVVLDLWFVLSLNMGIRGLAWATFTAQGVSSVLAMGTLLFRIRSIHSDQRPPVYSLFMLKKIMVIAVPSILQQSFISVGQLFVQSIVNGFGSVTVAGYSAALKINTFAIMAMNTISGALSSFTAQNFGAQKLERIKQGFKAALILALTVCSVMVFCALAFADHLIGFFADSSAGGDFISAGRMLLWIAIPFHFSVVIKILCDGVLRGAGFMRGFMISTFTDLFIRVIFSFAAAPFIGFAAICWAYPAGWVFSTFIAVYYYKSEKWKRSRSLAE